MEKLKVLQCTVWADIFYHSPLRIEGKPHRGGVPILFPQFASVGPLRKHGYARDSIFQTEHEQIGLGVAEAQYSLEVIPGDWPDWPYAANLKWRIQANPQALKLSLQVSNTGQDAFSWTGGLHPYFRVSNLRNVVVEGLSGLSGLSFVDKFMGPGSEQTGGLSNWHGQEFERHYLDCANIKIIDLGMNRSIQLEATGFSEWMVWNPGKYMAAALPDLPEGHWAHFICVEPVAAVAPIFLPPGRTYEGVLTIKLSGV